MCFKLEATGRIARFQDFKLALHFFLGELQEVLSLDAIWTAVALFIPLISKNAVSDGRYSGHGC